MAVAEAHPSDEELAAFMLGTLSDEANAVIEAHVAKCPTCQERAAGAPGDTLIELLRSTHVPRSRRWLSLTGLAILLFAGVLIAVSAIVYRTQTDKGDLVIETDTDDVEVVIRRNGEVVRIIDTRTQHEVVLTLPSGEYDMELKGATEGLKLSADSVTLTRGKSVLVKIERAPRPRTQSSVADLPHRPGFLPVLPRLATIADHPGVLSPDARLIGLPMDQHPGDLAFVRVCEAATGRVVRDLIVLGEFFSHWAFLPDGKHVLTVGGRRAAAGKGRFTFRVWDLENGTARAVEQIEALLADRITFVLSRDGKRILATLHAPRPAVPGGFVRHVLDLETGRVLLRIGRTEEKGNVQEECQLLSDGKRVIRLESWGDSPTGPWRKSRLHIVDVEGSLPEKLIEVDAHVTDPVVLPGDDRFAALCRRARPGGGAEIWMQIWNLRTGKLDAERTGRIQCTDQARLRARGERVITVDIDRVIRTFEMPAGKEVEGGDRRPADVISWIASADGRLLVFQTPHGYHLYRLPDSAARDKQ